MVGRRGCTRTASTGEGLTLSVTAGGRAPCNRTAAPSSPTLTPTLRRTLALCEERVRAIERVSRESSGEEITSPIELPTRGTAHGTRHTAQHSTQYHTG